MKTFYTFFLFTAFLFGAMRLADASEVPVTEQAAVAAPGPTPWFTGSLLAATPTVVPPGHINIEPFLFGFISSAKYDNDWKRQSAPNFYTVLPFVFIEFGFAKNLDITIISQFSYKNTQGESSTRFNDLFIALGYQLIDVNETLWLPAIKLQIGETFPTAPYQRLNPRKLGTDIGGLGSYSTKVSLVFSKLFHIYNIHYLQVIFTPYYSYSAPVHVKGFNAYGGDFGTDGKVHPGNSLETTLTFEYSLSQRWSLALDIDALFKNHDRFSGKRGVVTSESPPAPATVGEPATAVISLAPAIEYSWSPNMGVIGGCWFTVAGKNSSQFTTGVIAYNYYY